MGNTLIITERENCILTTTVEEGTVSEFQVESAGDENILGNIYVGRVQNIVKNINSAFVEYAPGKNGYLSLEQPVLPRHARGAEKRGRVSVGDELIVQVDTDAVKTKSPTLTGRLSFPGRYLVLVDGEQGVSISRKIRDAQDKERIRGILGGFTSQEFGIIARTNIQQASEEEIAEEMEKLLRRYRNTFDLGCHRRAPSCLYQAPSGFLTSVSNAFQGSLEEVITDSEKLYREMKAFLDENGWLDKLSLTLWEKSRGNLSRVYNIDRELREALSQRVWLKSGAYVVIQPTEALVAIDVNSGRAVSKKKKVQESFFKINCEAAREIARQMRLRNLSGMILVDFIDLYDKEKQRELMRYFEKELERDRTPSQVVDMTKLGLLEVTRKKVRKPLYEIMKPERTDREEQGK